MLCQFDYISIARIDPHDCGCTDCICGESKPINKCSDDELLAAYLGIIENASSCGLRVNVEPTDNGYHNAEI